MYFERDLALSVCEGAHDNSTALLHQKELIVPRSGRSSIWAVAPADSLRHGVALPLLCTGICLLCWLCEAQQAQQRRERENRGEPLRCIGYVLFGVRGSLCHPHWKSPSGASVWLAALCSVRFWGHFLLAARCLGQPSRCEVTTPLRYVFACEGRFVLVARFIVQPSRCALTAPFRFAFVCQGTSFWLLALLGSTRGVDFQCRCVCGLRLRFVVRAQAELFRGDFGLEGLRRGSARCFSRRCGAVLAGDATQRDNTIGQPRG